MLVHGSIFVFVQIGFLKGKGSEVSQCPVNFESGHMSYCLYSSSCLCCISGKTIGIAAVEMPGHDEE